MSIILKGLKSLKLITQGFFGRTVEPVGTGDLIETSGSMSGKKESSGAITRVILSSGEI